MSLQENFLVRWWLVSERKYATLKKMTENSSNLSFEQVRRVKTAWACYEVVPAMIMTPITFKMIRALADAHRTNQTMKTLLLSYNSAVLAISYLAAIAARDTAYWPIVENLYL